MKRHCRESVNQHECFVRKEQMLKNYIVCRKCCDSHKNWIGKDLWCGPEAPLRWQTTGRNERFNHLPAFTRIAHHCDNALTGIPILHTELGKRFTTLMSSLSGQMYIAEHLGQYQSPTGRGFQLRDGSGSGIGKNISGRIGYGLGTGIFIIYLINRVLSGSANLDRVFFGYLPTSYSSHGTWWFPVGPYVVDACWWLFMVQHD